MTPASPMPTRVSLLGLNYALDGRPFVHAAGDGGTGLFALDAAPFLVANDRVAAAVKLDVSGSERRIVYVFNGEE